LQSWLLGAQAIVRLAPYFSFPSYFYKPLFNYQAVFALIAQGISGALAVASG